MNLSDRPQVGATGLLLLSLIFGLYLFGCDESPFEPEEIVEEGYKIYFHTYDNPERWITYNPETNHLDSITLPTPIGYRSAISPAGNRLYLSRYVGHGLVVIDLETKELITELSGGVYYLDLSPDGKQIAIGMTDFSLVNTTDWSVQFSDTLWPLTYTTFSMNGMTLMGSFDHTYGYTSTTEPATITAEPVRVDGNTMFGGRVLTSSLTDHWYLTSGPFFFIDWDAQNDTTVFVDTAYNGGTGYTHQITRNGKYVAYLNDWYARTRGTEINIYDTESKTVVDVVDTRIYHETGDTTLFTIHEMVTTPDSKWLVGISRWATGNFFVYNLEELKMERFVQIPDSLLLFGIACQTGL